MVVEEPLQININGRPFSITMRTPGADEELVKGLLLAEGIVRMEGLRNKVALESRDGHTIADVSVPEMYLCEDLLEKRSLIANASCGFCGKQELADIEIQQSILNRIENLNASHLPHLLELMQSRQVAFAQTGGCHAAAVFGRDGDLLAQYEDVGRHNAVDKVVGRLVIESQLTLAATLVVSGRVSFEIVSKAAAAGIPVICAVSAPSSLAVDTAQRLGLTLAAFCRDNYFTVYTHLEILAEERPSNG